MKPIFRASLPRLVSEVVVYAALIALYYFLVLHFVGGELEHLFKYRRRLYAGLALGLIVAQGLLLEVLTRFLLNLTPRRKQR